MSYIEMAAENIANKKAVNKMKLAAQQRMVANAEAFGKQTGADMMLREVQNLLSQPQRQTEYNHAPQGLADSFAIPQTLPEEAVWAQNILG